MPSSETVERFIARVEQNAHAEAIEEFYTVFASMQENLKPPRIGRDALVARERKVMARARSVHSQCVRPVFISGNHVVVRWRLRFEWLDGSTSEKEELARQRWDGDERVFGLARAGRDDRRVAIGLGQRDHVQCARQGAVLVHRVHAFDGGGHLAIDIGTFWRRG